MSSENNSTKLKLLRQSNEAVLSPAQRRASDILVVEPEHQEREIIRNALVACDYPKVHVSPDHTAALKILETRHFTHLIFIASSTSMPPTEFLSKCMESSPQLVAIASSHSPNADDVFNLLKLGARGFLVKPYNISSLDASITLATTGSPLPDVVLQSANRNDAFATLLLSSLDRYAVAARQARSYSTAKKELVRCAVRLENISRIAKMFAQFSEAALTDSIVNLCLALSEGPATRLGRLRGKLKQERFKTG